MPVSKLNADEIQVAMSQLDHWILEPQQPSIYKDWNFNNFRTTIKVLNQICELAESHDHHPEILTSYTHLRIRLWTHDAGGLSHRDFSLASAIDQLMTSQFNDSIQH